MRGLKSIILLLLIPCFGEAQGPREMEPEDGVSFDLRVDRRTTGSGHYNFIGFGGSLNYRRFSLYGAALLGDKEGTFNGMAGHLQFFPASYGIAFGDRVYPYFQYSFVGRWDARLVSSTEGILRSRTAGTAKNARYRTFENYGGFGAQLFFIARFYLDLGLGIGLYDSKLSSGGGTRKQNAERFRRARDVSFSLRASLGYHF